MASSGNFATWNGVVKPAYTDFEHGNTKSDGNTGTDAAGANSSIGVGSGKWYAEFYLTVNTTYPVLGLSPGSSAADNRPFNSNSGFLRIVGYKPGATTKLEDNSAVFSPASFGTITLNQTNVLAGATGDIIGMALDVDNKKVWLSKNGTFMNSGDPAAGSNQQISWTTNPPEIFFNCITYTGGRAVHGNWGQDSTFAGNTSAGGNADDNGFGDFKYAPPTGFLALCSGNLPTSDDIDPAQTDDDYPQKQFNTILYTGIGGTSANNVTGVGFQPDLIWISNREQTASFTNTLVDSSRGRSKVLYSQRTDAEATSSTNRDISSINSDGFTIQDTSNIDGNQSGIGYVAWCWRANGGTTASDSNGQTTSTVQANQAAGFSIVEYAGSLTSSGTKTIGHGLSKAPEFYMIKNPNKAGRWFVWHTGMSGASYMLELNSDAAEVDKSGNGSMSLPTSTVFSTNWTEGSNEYPYNHIAYVWHGVDGYSKFGSYTGNGNANGPFIYTGFRPRLLVLKRASSTGGWRVWDTARHTFNPNDAILRWNDGGAEDTANQPIDFLSNGFKVRSSNQYVNENGGTIIYMAWGDVPFKYNNTF
jgi:hypothetical protein